jgi:hypothetical protein
MRRHLTLVLIITGFCTAFAHTRPFPRNLNANNGLRFEENKGQWTDTQGNSRSDILYTLRDNGIDLYFTKEGIFYQWHSAGKNSDGSAVVSEATGRSLVTSPFSKPFPQPGALPLSTYGMAMKWMKANEKVEIIAEEPYDDYTNYYLGHRRQGVLGVRSFRKLTYKNLYRGIDIVYYFRNNHLKYDVVVHENGNLRDVRFNYVGANPKLIDGKLRIDTPMGYLEEQKPIASTATDNKVEIGYAVARQEISFRWEKRGLKREELIVDPELVWATYYGGTGGNEYGNSTAVDLNNNIYLSGWTDSPLGIASPGGAQTVYGGDTDDAFLVKFDSLGNRLWATYFGGENVDWSTGVATDSIGNVYMVGSTYSTSGIASGGFQNTLGGYSDTFLSKFNTAGALIWATYYGGVGIDSGMAVATDRHNNVFISGYTISNSGIGMNGYQNDLAGDCDGMADAFLAKVSSLGILQWGTYFGGVGEEISYPNCLNVDRSGNIFLAGRTTSTAGVASGTGSQLTFGGDHDAFVAKFENAGSLLWSTYYGGEVEEFGYATATDSVGNVYLGGSTKSTTNIAFAAYQDSLAAIEDGFIVKFNASGTRQWGTYYGGTGDDFVQGLATAGTQFVYVVGYSTGSDGIAAGGYQNTPGGATDAFVSRFGSSGGFQWGSYYGGPAEDRGASISVDTHHNLYFTGYTLSQSGIAVDGFQNSYGGGTSDAFLVKFHDTPGKIDQAIFFSPIQDVTVGDPPFPLSTRSRLPVIFTTSSARVTLAGNIVTIVAAGRDTVTASQPGDSVFNAALSVSQSFCIHPAKPAIVVVDALPIVLVSSATGGNQWFLNDAAIPAATDTILQITGTGIYKVQAHVDDCYSSFSNDINVVVTGVSSRAEPVTLYPNPSHDFLTVSGVPPGNSNLVLIDLMGRQIAVNPEKLDGGLKVDIRTLPVGMYLLKGTGGNNSFQVKFIKQ